MECVTRTADEDTVNDLNVYLFDAYSRELVLHSYLTSMELEFNCVPGNYELYVIANAYALTWGNCSMRKLLTGR